MKTYRFAEIRINSSEEFAEIITEKMMTDFLNISGDNNPLHIDPGYASDMGFKDRVVYGLLTSSLYSRLVGTQLPGKYALLHGIDIAFKHPVFIGDHLKIRGEVTHINEAYKQIEVKATITNQDGQEVSKAKIKVGFHEQ